MKTKNRKVPAYPPLPKEGNPVERVLKFLRLTESHQLVNHLMDFDDLTPALMAKHSRMPEQKIRAIAELKQRITPKIAARFKRCFGWPAHVLLTWQLFYDIEKELYRWEDRLLDFEWHVSGQELFLASIEFNTEMLKSDRVYLRKLLPARLRYMRRIPRRK